MGQHTATRRQSQIPALRCDSGDDTGQHISHTGDRHSRVAVSADPGVAIRLPDDGTGAFQDDNRLEALGKLTGRGQPIGLDIGGCHPEQTRSLTRVRCQHPVLSRAWIPGQQVESIGIDDQR